jgi:hypothetical protein
VHRFCFSVFASCANTPAHAVEEPLFDVSCGATQIQERSFDSVPRPQRPREMQNRAGLRSG